MSRQLGALLAIALAAAAAHADEPSTAPGAVAAAPPSTDDAPSTDDDPPPQGIGAAIGLATGGRSTAGGFRVRGHYTYQMSRADWFDGTASFTYGGGGAACFRDRANDTICDHGYLDGATAEIAAGVRRYFPAQGRLQPFARLSIGLAIVRFGDDDLTGLAVPVHVGAGVRARISSDLAVLVLSEGMFGVARFGGLGAEPQAGISITAGAELRLP